MERGLRLRHYPILLDAGLRLPEGVLIDNRYRGLSAEQIYNQLISSREKMVTSDGDNQPECTDQSAAQEEGLGPEYPTSRGGVGQVLDAPVKDEADEQERDWSIAVHQATTVAARAGRLPAGVQRTLQGAAEASVDWREMLRRFWSETTPADYSWARPNRRYIWAGLYLPGVQREGVGEVAIAVDCSGSVSDRQLRLFEAEIRSILEGQRPERVRILYFDTVVHKVETYEAGDQVTLRPFGGGGTDFVPCFEWLEVHGIQPHTLVFLTDLYGTFPISAPAYPVLWASTGGRQAPFGEIVPMQAASEA